ncbi:MAG: nicotinamide-nucleotide amidohydrolase family protein [Betaproteobacteria bacterium]|nr:nicotinamide-nucleotide amidohydrolase family protein [Betaproteobacteria bacterium]
MDTELSTLSLHIGEWLRARDAMLATAESCTGGWIAETLTATSGSSIWFERGWVTYSNAAKQDMLGVQASTLDMHGAVSEAVAREMAQGALARSQSQFALAVSGVAGPSGGTPDKPVGMVCFGWTASGRVDSATAYFAGDREAIRRQAVAFALTELIRRFG